MSGYLNAWGFGFSDVDIDVDENLPNFFKAVKLSEADWMVKEDKYYQNNYDMDLINDSLSDKLDDVKVAKSPIQGIHWYSILANPCYAEMFSYISINTDNRNTLIVDDDSDEENDCEQSDMVALILNLAFISDAFMKDIEFKAGISTQLKGIKMGQQSVKKLLGGVTGMAKLLKK